MTTLWCFGDSHTWVFEHVERTGILAATRLRVTRVGGATAFGLANPNSVTNALAVFTRELAAVPADDPVLFCLGEVDAGFLVWLRAQKRGTAVDDELADSLARYTRFLDVVAAAHRDLVVATVPLPTVRDYACWAGPANARRAVRASIAERTAATRRYNEGLRAWARRRGARVLDTEADLLDPATGLVRDRFRHPDPNDHHYDPDAFAPVVVARLRELGFD
jgi:hypothetical protein